MLYVPADDNKRTVKRAISAHLTQIQTPRLPDEIRVLARSCSRHYYCFLLTPMVYMDASTSSRSAPVVYATSKSALRAWGAGECCAFLPWLGTARVCVLIAVHAGNHALTCTIRHQRAGTEDAGSGELDMYLLSLILLASLSCFSCLATYSTVR